MKSIENYSELELNSVSPVLSEEELASQEQMVSSGMASMVYSYSRFWTYLRSGSWPGGYVQGLGYVSGFDLATMSDPSSMILEIYRRYDLDSYFNDVFSDVYSFSNPINEMCSWLTDNSECYDLLTSQNFISEVSGNNLSINFIYKINLGTKIYRNAHGYFRYLATFSFIHNIGYLNIETIKCAGSRANAYIFATIYSENYDLVLHKLVGQISYLDNLVEDVKEFGTSFVLRPNESIIRIELNLADENLYTASDETICIYQKEGTIY